MHRVSVKRGRSRWLSLGGELSRLSLGQLELRERDGGGSGPSGLRLRAAQPGHPRGKRGGLRGRGRPRPQRRLRARAAPHVPRGGRARLCRPRPRTKARRCARAAAAAGAALLAEPQGRRAGGCEAVSAGAAWPGKSSEGSALRL